MRRILFVTMFAAVASSCAGKSSIEASSGAAATPPPPITLTPETEDPPALQAAAWAAALPPLRFINTRTGTECSVRLYASDGSIDEQAAATIDRMLAERDAEPRPLHRRVLKLVVKAAAQLGVKEVLVVSSFRDNARKGSHHRHGEALDFSFPGVTAARLAAHLRKGARVGVGVYTHPRTQFVHLDVRSESYHWADGSPPGRWWRESRMTDRSAPARDAAYRPEQDLPGG